MKNHLLSYLKPFLFAVPLLIFSCSEDEDPAVAEPKLGVVEESLEVNAAYEDTDLLTLDVIQSSGLGFRTQSEADICANAVVTHNATTKRITIDFGTGCTSPKGVLRKGKILLFYSGTNFLFSGTSIIMNFEGYEVNGLKIEGSQTITSGGVDLINKKALLTVTTDNGKVTWPDNTYATYTSAQSRVLTLKDEGYDVSIGGTASGKSREGIAYTAAIIEPLILNQACMRTGILVPSKGKMDFNVLGITISADLGESACDKIAKITYPGGSKEITLD